MLLFYSAAQALCIDFSWREGSWNSNLLAQLHPQELCFLPVSVFISPHGSDKAEVETKQSREQKGGAADANCLVRGFLEQWTWQGAVVF